jgi:phosphoenolpyruvate phosphomutase / 2-hydroxyethylphosphonate cytidylyltransferase
MLKGYVYLGLTVDTLHHGHINLIKKALKHGKIIVGLITDKAIAKNKRLPLLNYNQRKIIIENISGVSKIVEQTDWDYSINLKKYKPEYMIHGDDWLQGPQFSLRKKAINVLKSYGGKLIEIPHTKDISSTALVENQYALGITPDIRLNSLRRNLEAKGFLRFIEAHSPISALIIENLKVNTKKGVNFFDGCWSSSLTDSARLGKPDNEVLNISDRLYNINQIFDVTTKPLIMDIDTGGRAEHLKINLRSMERLGISAVIMEDKRGLKKNSLLGTKVKQYQDSIKNFCEKIKIIKQNQLNKDFMIISRIESLILKNGMNDALKRADSYLNAGSDGIMIHSKEKSPKEIFEFAKKFRKKHKDVPLVCVPSSYNGVKESELIKKGFNIVIYANQLFRAAYPSMNDVAISILKNGRSKEIDKKLISIDQILNLIPGTV